MTLQRKLAMEREEGRAEGRIELLLECVRNGYITINRAADELGKTVEEVQDIINQREKQTSPYHKREDSAQSLFGVLPTTWTLEQLMEARDLSFEKNDGGNEIEVIDDIKAGLEQAIQYEKGELNAKASTLSILPVESFTPGEIKSIRESTGLTQMMFANYIGVSAKTLEAWETGRSHPDGAACRLLTITKNDPSFPVQSGIITMTSRITQSDTNIQRRYKSG